MGLLTYIASLLSLNGLVPPVAERTHQNAIAKGSAAIERVAEVHMPVANAGKEQETPVVIERVRQHKHRLISSSPLFVFFAL